MTARASAPLHTAAVSARPQPMPLVGRLLLVVLVVSGLALAAFDPVSTILFLVYAIPGIALVIRRPRELVGWLLFALAFGFLGTTLPADIDVPALVGGTASWRDFAYVWVGSWSGAASFSLFVALILVFPSGHLPARHRRAAQVLLAAAAFVVWMAATAPTISFNPSGGVESVLVPNRLSILPESPLWAIVPTDLLILPMVAIMVVAVASTLVRYRRAAGIERLQLRWLVAAVTAVVAGVITGLVTLSLFDVGAAWIPAMLSFLTVPLAILVAVTRYRLYEIDRLISRTVSWLLLTLVLAAVFAGAVIGLQAVLAPVTGSNTLAVAASTLLAAALFQPVRARIQRLVDRRFNRARIDAEGVSQRFAAHVRDEVDLASLRRELESTTRAAVAPSTMRIWLRSAAEGHE